MATCLGPESLMTRSPALSFGRWHCSSEEQTGELLSLLPALGNG
jgi:hypothetical protein